MTQIKQINDAIKRSGLKRSDIREWVFIDGYGNRDVFKPRTQKLRFELEILFTDKDSDDYEIGPVFVNALHQVVVNYRFAV